MQQPDLYQSFSMASFLDHRLYETIPILSIQYQDSGVPENHYLEPDHQDTFLSLRDTQ
jgi:hypothetical protein